MRPSIYKVENIGNGFLAIMARPKAGEWIEYEFKGLRELGVSCVVSLLETTEAWELGLNEEKSFCEEAGLGFINFSIPDRGLPSSFNKLSNLICCLYHQITEGQNTVIHCRAGIGRSSIIAAAVLRHGQCSVETALEKISRARGVRVPDTEEQIEWLLSNQTYFQECHLVNKDIINNSESY